MTPTDAFDLVDYRRKTAELYSMVRSSPDPRHAHRAWIDARNEVFAHHPQSAVVPDRQDRFPGLDYWPYDPQYRTVGVLAGAPELTLDIQHSGEGTTRFQRVGALRFELRGRDHQLDLYWLDAYGGGFFVPFKDATNGTSTYGGGRYLLDTVKGADLGSAEGGLTLDFNFAYHPSCVYDDRWSCPLAPPGNRLDFDVTAGERLGSPTRRPRALR